MTRSVIFLFRAFCRAVARYVCAHQLHIFLRWAELLPDGWFAYPVHNQHPEFLQIQAVYQRGPEPSGYSPGYPVLHEADQYELG